MHLWLTPNSNSELLSYGFEVEKIESWFYRMEEKRDIVLYTAHSMKAR